MCTDLALTVVFDERLLLDTLHEKLLRQERQAHVFDEL